MAAEQAVAEVIPNPSLTSRAATVRRTTSNRVLLGLLGSDHAGERDAAGLAAHRLIKSSGMVWADVVCRPQDSPVHEHHADPLGRDWRMAAWRARQFEHLINRWEADFLAGLPRFPRLSAKQRDTLIAIAGRLRAAGCEL